MNYETVWNGSMRDTYLCVRDLEETLRVFPCALPDAPRRWIPRDQDRQRLFALMAEQPVWRVGELQRRLGIAKGVMSGLLYRAKRRRLIRSVQPGRVALVRRKVAA